MHGHQARTMVTEMNSVLMIFEAVEDPRTGSRTVHNLAEIITMCLLAVLSGCNRISEIHFLMENHLDRLERFLSLEHGLLSLSQLYKILAMIRPAALQQALVSFHNHLAAEIRPVNPAGLDLVAIDDKLRRGAIRRADRATPLAGLNAYSTLYGTVIGQLGIPEKTNEITAIRDFVRLLDAAARRARPPRHRRRGPVSAGDGAGDPRCQGRLAADAQAQSEDHVRRRRTLVRRQGRHHRFDSNHHRRRPRPDRGPDLSGHHGHCLFQAMHAWPELACIAEVVNQTT